MKAVVAAFNQEKALVGAFSVITNLRMELFQALVDMVEDVPASSCPVSSLPMTGGWLTSWHPDIPDNTPEVECRGRHAVYTIHYTDTPGPHSASYSSGAGDLSSWPAPVSRCHTWHEDKLHCIQTNIIYFYSIQNDNNSDQAENKYFLGCNNQYEHSCLPPVAGCMQLRPLRGGRGKKLEPGNKWWHDPNICHSHATIAQKLKWPMNMGTSDPWHIQRGLGEDTVMTSTSITPYSTIVSVLSFEYEHTERRFFNFPLE